MSRKYYRLLKSSLRGRDPFFNVVTLIVVEIVALAYAATVLASAIGVSNDRIAEYHYDSPAKIVRR